MPVPELPRSIGEEGAANISDVRAATVRTHLSICMGHPRSCRALTVFKQSPAGEKLSMRLSLFERAGGSGARCEMDLSGTGEVRRIRRGPEGPAGRRESSGGFPGASPP